jgi:hypothetical protein
MIFFDRLFKDSKFIMDKKKEAAIEEYVSKLPGGHTKANLSLIRSYIKGKLLPNNAIEFNENGQVVNIKGIKLIEGLIQLEANKRSKRTPPPSPPRLTDKKVADVRQRILRDKDNEGGNQEWRIIIQ